MFNRNRKKETQIITQAQSLQAYPRTEAQWRNYLLAELARYYATRLNQVYIQFGIMATLPEWRVASRYLTLGVRLANMKDVDKAIGPSMRKAIGHACGLGDGTADPPILINLVGGLLVYQFMLPEFYNVGHNKVRLWADVFTGQEDLEPGSVGVTLYSRPIFFEFTDSHAHALIAGASGSGKTELVRTMLYNMLVHKGPDKLRIALVDPAAKFLNFFNEEHLLWQPVHEAEAAKLVIHYCWLEYKRRFDTKLYDEPRWVLVIDEADQIGLVGDDETQQKLSDIANRGRGVRVNLLVCSHRPDQASLGPFSTQLTNRWFGKTGNARESGLFEGGLELHHLGGKGDFYCLTTLQPTRFQVALTQPELVKQLNFVASIKTVQASTGPLYVPVEHLEPDKPAHRPKLQATPEIVAYLRFYGLDNINQADTRRKLKISRRELDVNIQFARRQGQIENAMAHKFKRLYAPVGG